MEASKWVMICQCPRNLRRFVTHDSTTQFAAIKEGLDHAYRQGEISEALYAASCGHARGTPGQP